MSSSISAAAGHIFFFMKNTLHGQVVIQITDNCNAKCPQCGMRITEKFKRSRLANDEIKKIIDAAASRKTAAISFTGGEPFLYTDDLLDLIGYAGKKGIKYIRTGTNGYLFANPQSPRFYDKVQRLAERMSKTRLRNFWISLDSSVPEKHEKMRGLDNVVKGIEKALPIFHSHGIFPSANLGINRNLGRLSPAFSAPRIDTEKTGWQTAFHAEMKKAFSRFYTFVEELGFTMVNTCYPMSIEPGEETGLNAAYAATSTDNVVRFTKQEKAVLFSALLDTIPKFRSRLRIFTPLSSLHALCKQHGQNGNPAKPTYPCRGGIDFFFINAADGNTYPCGYRGRENHGKFWNLNGHHIDKTTHCDLCDWECFRDPSEMVGPVLELFGHPVNLAKRVFKDPAFFKLWASDLAYYRACRFFDGRTPPDYSRLAFFKPA